MLDNRCEENIKGMGMTHFFNVQDTVDDVT